MVAIILLSIELVDTYSQGRMNKQDNLHDYSGF